MPIVITTIGKASTLTLRERKFKTVIVDEATMVRETEGFLATMTAEQIILVGDQKQLGPTYQFEIKGPSSLFSRLV